MSNTPSLVLIHSMGENDNPLDQVKEIGELVDQLVQQNADLKEELERIRLALDMTPIEFAEFKDREFVFNRDIPNLGAALDKLIIKLEKVFE